MQTPINWQRFSDTIHSASQIVLTVHHRPDGDCIGSALAMQQMLLRLGKKVRIFSPHKTPPNLLFLDPEASITALEDMTTEDRQWFHSADLLFVLDTSSWAQLGEMATPFRESTAKKIVLDHHAIGEDIGAETFIDSTAEATGALVVQAVDAMNVPMTLDIARPAFVAMATDTGWFRFSNVSSATFTTAGRLLDVGVQPDALYKELFEQESLGRLRLVGRTLAKTESYMEGQFLLTWIRLEDLDAAGAIPSDSEDVVNMLLQVQGTKMAVLLSELKDKSFKVSFRSRCEADCSVLALQFGGGGHKKAAGATLLLPFEQARQAIVEAVESTLRLC